MAQPTVNWKQYKTNCIQVSTSYFCISHIRMTIDRELTWFLTAVSDRSQWSGCQSSRPQTWHLTLYNISIHWFISTLIQMHNSPFNLLTLLPRLHCQMLRLSRKNYHWHRHTPSNCWGSYANIPIRGENKKRNAKKELQLQFQKVAEE